MEKLSKQRVNIPLDLTYDQCYHLHAKTTSFYFTFALIIVNPIILVLVLKITWCNVLVVKVLLKLLGSFQAMHYFKVWLCFSYHSICEICKFDTHKSLSYSLRWISFPMSLICKNLNVNLNLGLKLKFAKRIYS